MALYTNVVHRAILTVIKMAIIQGVPGGILIQSVPGGILIQGVPGGICRTSREKFHRLIYIDIIKYTYIRNLTITEITTEEKRIFF